MVRFICGAAGIPLSKDNTTATIDDVCRWLLAYSQRAIIYLNK